MGNIFGKVSSIITAMGNNVVLQPILEGHCIRCKLSDRLIITSGLQSFESCRADRKPSKYRQFVFFFQGLRLCLGCPPTLRSSNCCSDPRVTSTRIKSFECTLSSSKQICKHGRALTQYKEWSSRDIHDNSWTFSRLLNVLK